MGTKAARFLALSALVFLTGTSCAPSVPTFDPSDGAGGIAITRPGEGGAGGGSVGAGGAGGHGGEPGPEIEVRGVHPAHGTVEGQTRVTITGAGFVSSVPGEGYGASTLVFFGENPSLDIRVLDDTTILATTPTGLAGPVDVVVRNSSGEGACAGCFRYLPALRLDSIEPNAASLEGGTLVVLRGEGLDEGTTVLFGSRAALSPRLAEDGSLHVVLPPGDEPGPVDVRAYGASRQSLLRRAFRYLPPLRVDGVEPPTSPLAGGARALLRGEGFTAATQVFFGEEEAEVELVEAGLEVVIPPGSAAGPVHLEVREGGHHVTFPFAYFDPTQSGLALHAVAPAEGPVAGGQEVILLGSGFDQGGQVLFFGESFSPSLSVESPNILRAVAPPGPAGAVDLRLRTLEGASTLPQAYRYLHPLEFHGVEPASGPVGGGTLLTLRGAGFPENPRVFVGALEATEVRRIHDGQLEVVAPPGTDGAVPVRVLDGDAPGHQAVLESAFTYEGALELAVAEPATGARAGGTLVRLRGRGFWGEMRVFFGEVPADSVVVVDPYTLEVLAPRGEVGQVDLRVEREDGAQAALDGGFYYFNPSAHNGGSSGGPLRGTLNVTAIARSGPHRNRPIEGCQVQVGADETTQLVKETDDRGQVTFSSPSLVKAVTLSVACEDYELATFVNQVSENITVLLRFTGVVVIEPPDEEDEDEDDIEIPPPPGISTIVARVYGFKPPVRRKLRPNEELLARLSLAHWSVYSAPPLGGERPTFEIREEGIALPLRFTGAAHITLYAVYGIHDVDTGHFEPLLFGFVPGITAPEHQTVEVDVILDSHLNQVVPVHLPEPYWFQPGSITVRAFLDLGQAGIIPLDLGTNASHLDRVVLRKMPPVSGENLLFQVWGSHGGARPWSLTFLRQAGDPTQGVHVGPLMAPAALAAPSLSGFDGVIEWEVPPSTLAPDAIHLQVYDTGTGRPLWHAVLAGYERRVRIPDALLAEILSRSEGRPLRVELLAGSQPTFDFTAWDYQSLGRGSFVSFSVDSATLHP